MSDIDEYFDKNDAVMKKLVSCHKQLKIILDSIKSIEFKVDAGLNFNKDNTKDTAEEKDKMDKIFEKKGLGRPVGTWDTKRKQYFDMINSGKIKEPRGQTIDYYNIKRGDDGKYYLND